MTDGPVASTTQGSSSGTTETAAPEVAPEAAPAPLVTGGQVTGLDGLRGLGMIVMFAYHADLPWVDGAFLGLSQFFTLSGFLVASGLLREHQRTGTISLGNFWARRFRRLAPGAMLALLGVVLFSATVGTADQVARLPREALAAVLYVVNWEFVTADRSYAATFDQPSPLQHFWSLSVEEQFYLFVPLVLLGLLAVVRSRRVLGALIVAAMVASWWQTRRLFGDGSGFDRVYLGTDTRVGEILVGVLVAVLIVGRPAFSTSARRALAWSGAAIYVASLWMIHRTPIDDPTIWRGGIGLFALATGLIIVAIVAGGGPLRLLDARPLVSIGRHCYGIYLFHWPIFLWLTEDRTGLDTWPLFVLRTAVTLPIAYLSNRYIETPIREGRSFGLPAGRRWLAVPVSSAVVVGALAVVAWRAPDAPTKTFGSEELAAAPAAADPVLDVLVVSDGTGRAIDEVLRRRAADDADLAVTITDLPPCTSLVETDTGRTCSEWNAAFSSFVDDHDPDVVLLFGYALTPEQLAALDPAVDETALAHEVLSAGVDVLGTRGAPVVWSAMTPTLEEGVRLGRDPFFLAVSDLRRTNSSFRRAPDLPYADDPTDPVQAGASVDVLLPSLEANRRRSVGDKGLVMVVGDSQAQSLAFGLERWSLDQAGPLVWNAGVGGCGLVGGGQTIGIEGNVLAPPRSSCRTVVEDWSRGVADARPDRVVVWTSVRDLQPRQLEGWSEVEQYGDDRFDEHVIAAYVAAYDAFSAEGASVIWIVPPCVKRIDFGYDGPGSPLTVEAIDHLRDTILPALVRERPDVELFDLAGDLCPDGRFRDSVAGVGDLRPDGIHLSAEGSTWLAGRIGPDLLRIDD